MFGNTVMGNLFIILAVTLLVWNLITLRYGSLTNGLFAVAYAWTADRRPPDVVLVNGKGGEYLRRWWLIPRNRWFNIYIHNFRDDDPAVPHDHPWWSASYMLAGSMFEHEPDGNWRHIRSGQWRFRRADYAHRLALPTDGGQKLQAWTVFMTGPRTRDWGFHCPKGWLFWKDYGKNGQRDVTGCGELS